jgi:hypothetical protein
MGGKLLVRVMASSSISGRLTTRISRSFGKLANSVPGEDSVDYYPLSADRPQTLDAHRAPSEVRDGRLHPAVLTFLTGEKVFCSSWYAAMAIEQFGVRRPAFSRKQVWTSRPSGENWLQCSR